GGRRLLARVDVDPAAALDDAEDPERVAGARARAERDHDDLVVRPVVRWRLRDAARHRRLDEPLERGAGVVDALDAARELDRAHPVRHVLPVDGPLTAHSPDLRVD